MKKNYLVALLLLATSITVAQVPSYVPTSGLVGWYPFSGNANDLSPNHNNGIDSGAVLTTDRFGNANSAYSFNGTSGFIDMGNTTTLNISGNMTLSCWIAPHQPWGGRIIDKGIQNTNSGYVVNMNLDGTIRFIGGNQNLYSRTSIDTSIWNDIAVIFDYTHDSCFFYINGHRDTFYTNLPNGITSNSTHLNIGSASASGTLPRGEYYLGKIDDIGIWNRALTQVEISQLYAASGCTYFDTIRTTVYDTIRTRINVYDTVTTSISVTDTLYINANLTGITAPNNINVLKAYPNPTKSELFIDCGNYANMTGYSIKIVNDLGQSIFSTTITQQIYDLSLNQWSGQGTYFLYLIDPNHSVVATKQIVLQ